jgi:mono/diheme cytochrome c family protein
VPSSPESIAAGTKVYAVWCRSCHGLRGRGDGIAAPPGTKPANLVDAEWKHGATDAEIFKTIKDGIAPFDAMKPQAANLSDADIWNVVNYLRSLAAVKK